MKTKPKFSKKYTLQVILVLSIVIGAYGILPQIGSFKGSFTLLKHSYSSVFTSLAFAFSMLTYVFAALVYCQLAIKPLQLGRTVIMQLAAMFINRILPAGIGALGMNAAYLRNEKHTLAQAGVIVGLNNLVGMLGHGLLLLIAYIFWQKSFMFHPNISSQAKTYIFVASAVLIAALLIVLKIQSKSKLKNIKKQLKQITNYYGDQPWKLVMALIFAMCLTLAFTSCLLFSLKVLGVNVTLPAALLLLTFGVGAGTAVPLPGGVGGVEAGIYAGLLGMHTDPQKALAGVLLFRLVSYWIPLAIGFLAFLYSQKKHYVSFK